MTVSFERQQLETLLSETPSSLFSELGIRSLAIEERPELAEQIEIVLEPGKYLGPAQDFSEIGKTFFDKVNKNCYELVCSSEELNREDREKLIRALSIGPTDVALCLSTILVSYHVVAPALAGVIATLIVKICYQPACETICEFWANRLPPK